MPRRTLIVVLSAVALAVGVPLACQPKDVRVGARAGYAAPVADTFSQAAGTAGTYTVPTGFFVTSWWAHNTVGGATVVITPTGAREYSACVDAGCTTTEAGTTCTSVSTPCASPGPTLTIPAATGHGDAVPVLLGGPDELGEGTVFVFSGTDSYVLTLRSY
jgi:hypothetical protein